MPSREAAWAPSPRARRRPVALFLNLLSLSAARSRTPSHALPPLVFAVPGDYNLVLLDQLIKV